ncbi:MAG: glycoside hydrolase [Thaumarchaeota archaeon]|nr:glycoside hydrolase [Nitrososphaerota archaeon]
MTKTVTRKMKTLYAYSLAASLLSFLLFIPASFAVQNSISFSPAVNLSNDANNARFPMVANSGSNVYVVWTEQSHGIYLRYSSDGGISWNPLLTQSAMRLSLKGGTASYPVITANGTNVYVAWAQTVNTISQIYFSISTDSGGHFSKPVILDLNSTLAALTPVLASWGSNVYLAWAAGSRSFERTSNDGGVTWSTVNPLGSSHEPQLAAYGSYAYFISDGISYWYSSDNGGTWHKVNLKIGHASEPWIAASGPNVYVTWEQKKTNKTAPIYGEISNDYGVTFTSPKVLSGTVINDWEPQLIASGNNVYLAFRSLSPQSAWITSSSTAGATWNAPVRLSMTNHPTGWPLDVAVSGNNVFTIFGSANSNGGTVWNAYASYSADGGTTWTSPPGMDLSGNSVGVAASASDIASASIMANGASGYAAWESSQTGINQIWFAGS